MPAPRLALFNGEDNSPLFGYAKNILNRTDAPFINIDTPQANAAVEAHGVQQDPDLPRQVLLQDIVCQLRPDTRSSGTPLFLRAVDLRLPRGEKLAEVGGCNHSPSLWQ